MAGNAEGQPGSSLKRRNPGLQARVSGNEVNDQENNVMSKNSTNVIPFKFNKQEVRTLLIDDQPWFVAADVSVALEYSEASAMTRHLDDDEKGLSIVQTLGGDQEMLVINESGLYSAILRSRKVEAKRFKKWVTSEVLPAIRRHGRYEDSQGRMGTLIGQTIGTDGFHMLGAVVKGKVVGLPKALQRRATSKIWSQTHAAFGVRSAEDIPADQLDSARNFIAAYTVLEGEFLGKEEPTSSKVNWPATRWLAESAPKVRERMTILQGAGNIMLAPDMLFGPDDCVSPTLRAIAELERQGHNLEACRLEVLAMKHHLEDAEYAFSGLRLWTARTQGRGIRFGTQGGAA